LHWGGNIDPFHAEIAHIVANRMIAQFCDRNVRWDSEITLHPTFLSWLKNLNALFTLINRLSELAAAAPQEYQLQLNRQVDALRAGFKKQQERCISFLQLVGEYADRLLSDIAEEILQQSSFLDALKRRLDRAKTLCNEVVQLRKSYEFGTLDYIKKIRRTVLSQPLHQDIDLFREMDIVLNEVRQCYIEMNKFWADEVRHVTKALMSRRIDPEDVSWWKNFGESLEDVIVLWATTPTGNGVVPHPSGNTQIPVHDLGTVVSSLLEFAKAAQRALMAARLCTSAQLECVKPVHHSFLLTAEVKFSENRTSCLEYLRGCLRYGKSVVMTCAAFAPYSSFPLLRSSQDLVDHATGLGKKSTEIPAEPAIRTRGTREFNSIHKKCFSSLHRMDRKLNTLFNRIPTWVAELNAYSTFPVSNVKRLRGLSRIWVKNRDDMNHVFAALPLFDD